MKIVERCRAMVNNSAQTIYELERYDDNSWNNAVADLENYVGHLTRHSYLATFCMLPVISFRFDIIPCFPKGDISEWLYPYMQSHFNNRNIARNMKEYNRVLHLRPISILIRNFFQYSTLETELKYTYPKRYSRLLRILPWLLPSTIGVLTIIFMVILSLG